MGFLFCLAEVLGYGVRWDAAVAVCQTLFPVAAQ